VGMLLDHHYRRGVIRGNILPPDTYFWRLRLHLMWSQVDHRSALGCFGDVSFVLLGSVLPVIELCLFTEVFASVLPVLLLVGVRPLVWLPCWVISFLMAIYYQTGLAGRGGPLLTKGLLPPRHMYVVKSSNRDVQFSRRGRVGICLGCTHLHSGPREGSNCFRVPSGPGIQHFQSLSLPTREHHQASRSTARTELLP
jgi:hypothetical protein